MQRRILAIGVITLVTSTRAFAQTVQPGRIAAGEDVTFSQDCKTDKPQLTLDKDPIPASGKSKNPNWVFEIPATTASQKYAVTFVCAGQPNIKAGELEVTVKAQTPPGGSSASEPTVVSALNFTKSNKNFSQTVKKAASAGATPEQAKADADVEANKASRLQGESRAEPVELKDLVRLEVRDLDGWLKDPKNSVASLWLFLCGLELKNVVPVQVSKDPAALMVRLEPNSDNEGVIRKAWVQALRAAYYRELDIGVGVSGQAPFATTAKVALQVYPDYTAFVLAFLALVILVIIILGKSTNTLRDSNGSTNPPYSLAKHQMAVWFVAVVGSYLYIWLITGFFSSISTTALTLIGISGATGLIALTMDASKRTDTAKTRITLEAERDALDKTLNDPATGLQAQLKAAVPGSAAATELTTTIARKLARLQEIVKLLEVATPDVRQKDVWYKDLLSDANGISFHRLQMAIWTLVLVVVFIRAVYSDILMPDFDATLLGLMGISSGTYLGFKLPEKAA